MWGAKPGLNLDFAKILMKRLIQGSIEMRESHGKGLDQLLLGRYMFPFLDGKYFQSRFQRCRWVFKSGWASSNVVAKFCPPGCNRVN